MPLLFFGSTSRNFLNVHVTGTKSQRVTRTLVSEMHSPSRQEGTHFHFFWKNPHVARDFSAGVSLHSHTMYSEEGLHTLPGYVGRVPFLERLLGRSVDYANGFWTPPLSPRHAYRVEEKQIQRRLGLPALVSLTDHDDIRAARIVQLLRPVQVAPISVEWTVPFGDTFFHLGVHNLPPLHAGSFMDRFKQFTADPRPTDLRRILGDLQEYEDVLIVANHPLWDEKRIGQSKHLTTLLALLDFAGDSVHALEANGLRSWKENREVAKLATEVSRPVVSGGDRHSCEPNAILNLTHGSTFAEFVWEVRQHRRSHIISMPQYKVSLRWRTMQTVVDILREYPNACGVRRTWPKRIFVRQPDGNVVPISSVWPAGKAPVVLAFVSYLVQMTQWRSTQYAIRTGLSVEEFRESIT